MGQLLKSQQMENPMPLLGRNLVSSLFVLLKTAQNYREGHAALALPVAKFLVLVREIHGLNAEAAIGMNAGCLALGDVRLKSDTFGFEAFRFMSGILNSYFIRSINFTPAVTEVEIKRFAYIFTEIEPVPSLQTFAKFQERLQRRMVQNIELESMSEDEELCLINDATEMDNKTRARRIYFQAIKEVAEVMDTAAKGRPLPLMKSKRIVQNMVDQLRADESELLALTMLKSNTEYTCNHAVNVAILSLAIGSRIGLSQSRKCELGIAALYHDIGKAFIPPAILNKDCDFSPKEEEIIQEHPLLGVKALLDLKGLDSVTAGMIAGNFEHHLHYDFSGYPLLAWKKQSLFGRIIGIADDYDSLTSARVYYRAPHAPEKVVLFMLSRSCKIYDPALIKLFLNAIGIYPIGTLLLLNTRELAVVVRNNRDPAKWKVPVVKIIAYPDGCEVDGELMNLADTHAGRSIARTMDPHHHKIDVSRYLF